MFYYLKFCFRYNIGKKMWKFQFLCKNNAVKTQEKIEVLSLLF